MSFVYKFMLSVHLLSILPEVSRAVGQSSVKFLCRAGHGTRPLYHECPDHIGTVGNYAVHNSYTVHNFQV